MKNDGRPALGFIGIGKMGDPMARRLMEAGYRLTVFNRTRRKTDGLRDAGARVADSPADVARDADVVLLCVTDAAAVEATVLGPQGVAAGGSAGKLLIDCSSIGPQPTRRLADTLEHISGMRWVDAPVSGGVAGARRGTLIFMCGGAPDDVAGARTVLLGIGQRCTHMGPLGSGQITKLCNQAIVSCNLAVIAEVISLAARAGVDAAALPAALAGGFADSQPLQIYGPRMATPVDVEQQGEIATMLKDVDITLAHAHDVGQAMPMTSSAAELYRLVAARGYRHRDLQSLVQLYVTGDAGAAESRSNT